MRITSSVFLVFLAASTTAARAQFGSGIVYDPTQSAHAVQQIQEAKQLYTTTVQTEQKVIAAYNLARQMANLPQSLFTSFTNLGRQQWTMLTQPANTYGNSPQWINAALTGIRCRWSEPGGEHSAHWPDHRLWFAKRSGTASHCRARRHGRFTDSVKRQQSANNRHNPSECSPTGVGHKPA